MTQGFTSLSPIYINTISFFHYKTQASTKFFYRSTDACLLPATVITNITTILLAKNVFYLLSLFSYLMSSLIFKHCHINIKKREYLLLILPLFIELEKQYLYGKKQILNLTNTYLYDYEQATPILKKLTAMPR